MKKKFFSHLFLSATVKAHKIFFLVFVFIGQGLFAQQIINSGGAIIMNGPVTMVVKNASFINNGIFAAGTYSNAIFSGTTAYRIGTTVTTVDSTNFYNLYITNTAAATILPYVGVKDTISVTAGTVNSAGNLTLLSTLACTANVSSTTVANSITGNVNVQRYIPGKRSWRLLTAPVAIANSIFSSWQNSGNYVVGKGMFVSGPAATNVLPTALNNGMDFSDRNNSSMKSWDYTLTTPSYIAVANTNKSISLPTVTSAANIGYFVFVRGDRARTNINNIINSTLTTLTSIGLLQTGAQTFTIPSATASGSYVLLGNPYAAPIDFDKVTLTNINKTFYTWDPAINVLGAFVTMGYNSSTSKYTAVPASGASQQTTIIQSGQALFVQTIATGNATSVAFNESNKSATISNNIGFRPIEPAVPKNIIGSLAANLYFVEKDSSLQLADGNLTQFNRAFSDNVTAVEDAVKFTNLNESFGLMRHGTTLAIESRPNLNANDTLFFKLWRTTRRPYRFVFEPKQLNKTNLVAYLQDKYLNSSKEISLNKQTSVNFEVDANAASAETNRFKMIFKTVYPFNFLSFNGYKKFNDIAVEWKVNNDADILQYDVEKASGINGFVKVNSLSGKRNNKPANTYYWLDKNAQPGENIYRIKIVNTDGSTKLSENITVIIPVVNVGIVIYPNPIIDGAIHLQITDQPAGAYQFNLTNNTGQVICRGSLQNNSRNSNLLINIKPSPASGLYNLEIITPQNKISTQKVIVN